ncbi:MAG: DUF1624 domain-containing protein, partial [Chloroflexi bacterium]
NYFGLVQTNIYGWAWQSFARSIASLFIFVMGVSLTLSYRRAVQKAGHRRLFGKYLRRGGQIFGLGMVITIATYFFIGPAYVRFGILHLLGASIIMAYPFLGRSRWLSLAAGVLGIVLGAFLNRQVIDGPWLLWLGVKQAGISMVDYYPLLPWGAITLLGIFAGDTLYPQGRRRFHLPAWGDFPLFRGLRFLGQHSLLIYLIHQPILIGLLMVLRFGN